MMSMPNKHIDQVNLNLLPPLVALLEERGWVERRPHPTDGRQLNLRLTAKGTAIRKKSKDARV